MAAVRNENKENCMPNLRKQGSNAMAAQTRRAALAQRNNTDVVEVHQEKPAVTNVDKEKPKFKQTKNADSDKENRRNIVNPIVPVAQFEAFKVYEDAQYEERMAAIDDKLKRLIKNKNTIQVYKGTTEDRFYTKTEVAELEKKRIEEEAAKSMLTGLIERKKLSPIVPEKNYDDEGNTAEDFFLKSSRSTKDSFFEIEDYRDDIYKYLREHELRHRPKPGYMRKQPDVTSNMRTILIDWLVEVAEEYSLHTETLYLAVNYIDRFLSYMSVVRAKLQLVGTAAMFLASKYEEITPPSIAEFVYITDDTYNKQQVIRMEHLILKVLGFDLSIPTALSFITAMCVSTDQAKMIENLAMYLSELALLNGDVYLEFLPSTLAASAIAVARHTVGIKAWTKELETMTGYSLEDLRAGIEFLTQMFEMAPKMGQHAIQDKYKLKKYMHVSQMVSNKDPVEYE